MDVKELLRNRRGKRSVGSARERLPFKKGWKEGTKKILKNRKEHDQRPGWGERRPKIAVYKTRRGTS